MKEVKDNNDTAVVVMVEVLPVRKTSVGSGKGNGFRNMIVCEPISPNGEYSRTMGITPGSSPCPVAM